MVLPSGTVTFLFSDVESSTQLLERHPHAMGAALARHHELFEELVAAHDGAIFETVGDAVYAAFSRATDAANAALAVQLALVSEDWGPIERIACRLALHSGEVEQRGDHYFGQALFRCARLQALGYGQQTLLSGVTADLVRHHLPHGASLRDLGTHRLKDLGEPEHVFALVHPALRDTFPPPKSLDLHPNNLPLQLSSFVGRERELERLEAMVRAHRLTTITGTGGMGKTRLALQLSAQLLGDDPNAAFFVDLAPVREPDEVVPAVAATLGVTPAPGGSLEAAVTGYLGTLRPLLVLDNAEQIERVGPIVVGLLERSPSLRVVVTSRGPLHVRGEQVFPLEPLPVDVAQTDARRGGAMPPAVRLFAERAAEVLPGFELSDDNRPAIAAICERLDGLPLAIELASARVGVFEPMTLLARLDRRLALLTEGPADQPERHQTLRATIDWSFQLLSEADRDAFCQLSVFIGGWSLEAAEAVAGADHDALARLINASLVYRRGHRFGMLETIREFADAANGQRADVEETRRRHAVWYHNWIVQLLSREKTARDLRSAENVQALLEERENVEAAIPYLLDTGDAERALQISVAVWHFWLSRGRARQGSEWLSRALELAPPEETFERAWALGTLGELLRWLGEFPRAIELKERALPMALRVGGVDALRVAAAELHDLAALWDEMGDLDKAEDAANQALELRRSIGQPHGIAHALDSAGWVQVSRGNLVRARELFEECVLQTRLADEQAVDMASAIGNVAEVDRRLGRLADAARGWAEVIDVIGSWDSTDMDCEHVQEIAALMTDAHRPDRAAQLLGAAYAMRRQSGLEKGAAGFQGACDQVRAALPGPAFDAAWQRGERMTRAEVFRRAGEAVRELAGVAHAEQVGL